MSQSMNAAWFGIEISIEVIKLELAVDILDYIFSFTLTQHAIHF